MKFEIFAWEMRYATISFDGEFTVKFKVRNEDIEKAIEAIRESNSIVLNESV